MSPPVPIAVVDHGAGNLVSIAQGLERAGAHPTVVDTPDRLDGAAGVVLPGVGSTGAVMEGIRRRSFDSALQCPSVPLLGICVGMQVLFERSEEDGSDGLGVLAGRVRRLANAPRLPHIGWNILESLNDPILFADLSDSAEVYFVHSFAPDPTDPRVVTSTVVHGSRFPASVRSGNVSGTQFHPERSGEIGLRILANFVAECRTAA